MWGYGYILCATLNYLDTHTIWVDIARLCSGTDINPPIYYLDILCDVVFVTARHNIKRPQVMNIRFLGTFSDYAALPTFIHPIHYQDMKNTITVTIAIQVKSTLGVPFSHQRLIYHATFNKHSCHLFINASLNCAMTIKKQMIPCATKPLYD